MPKRPKDCPCHSGARYAACCGPLLEGRAEAGSPLALMRSRYSATALGLGQYLVDSLSADHEDRGVEAGALALALSRVKERSRLLGLTILGAAEKGDEGEVTFYARIFVRGEDCSFTERSRFVREAGTWRYASGERVPELCPPPRSVFKVLGAAEWADARAAGVYRGSADDARDGFIHLSTREQLEGTLARHFAGWTDLVVVEVDAAALGGALRWEASRDGALFPHLYGELPLSATRGVRS